MIVLPTINLTETGKNITKLRKKSGYTVKELQKILGFATPQAIYKWQRGETLPTIDNIAVLAVLFGVKIDEIIVMDYVV